jgi:hypothetical protein
VEGLTIPHPITEADNYYGTFEMLSQLRLPTIIMLSMFAILKGLQCVEHIMRFAQSQKLTYDYSNMFYLMKEIDCIQLVNFTMTYFYISFKPFLFIFMSKRLRVDITVTSSILIDHLLYICTLNIRYRVPIGFLVCQH